MNDLTLMESEADIYKAVKKLMEFFGQDDVDHKKNHKCSSIINHSIISNALHCPWQPFEKILKMLYIQIYTC